ncbi:hypothetical protein WME99_30230 [Sorangium sp. So ce136]
MSYGTSPQGVRDVAKPMLEVGRTLLSAMIVALPADVTPSTLVASTLHVK